MAEMYGNALITQGHEKQAYEKNALIFSKRSLCARRFVDVQHASLAEPSLTSELRIDSPSPKSSLQPSQSF